MQRELSTPQSITASASEAADELSCRQEEIFNGKET